MADSGEGEKRATLGCGVGARHVVALAALGAVFLVSMVRTSLSVAVVAMVRPRQSVASTVDSGSALYACPGALNDTSANKAGGGDLQWGELEQSWVLRAHSYGSVLSALALSRLAESLGAARVLTALLAASAALNLLAPAAARLHIACLLVLRAVQGVAWGPLYSCVAILSGRWFPPDERHRMSGLVFSAGNMGVLASMGVSGGLAAHLGWAAIFYVYGGALLAWAALCLLALADEPSKHRFISPEEKLRLQQLCPPPPKERTAAVPWRCIASSGPVWAYLMQDAGCVWITVIFMSELPSYLTSILHSDVENAGYLSTLPFVCTWLSNVFSSSLSHWLRHKGLLSHLTSYRLFNAIATLGPAVALVAVAWAECRAAAVLALVALALTLHGAYYGGSLLNMLDLSVAFAGTLSGLANTLSGLVSVAAPTLVGLLTDNQESLSAWRTVFYVSAAVTSLPYVLFYALGSVEEQPWGRPREPPEPERPSSKAQFTAA